MGAFSFVELLEELAQEEITLTPTEVRRMRERFGEKALQMGHLHEDGSMSVPVDCIVESVQSLRGRTGEHIASALASVETLVEQVGEARKRKLARMVEAFQSEPDDANAHTRWNEIEKTVFGVKFPN